MSKKVELTSQNFIFINPILGKFCPVFMKMKPKISIKCSQFGTFYALINKIN